jgi:signal transduction histidine kinase
MSVISRAMTFIANRISLRVKLMAIVLLLVLGLGSWSASQAYLATRESLHTYLERTGVSIARAVAARSEDYILTNNLYQLHMLVTDTLANNPDVGYLFILGSEDQVVASSFSLSLPAGLREVNGWESPALYNMQTISTEKGLMDDIAVPILEGRAGTVRLGVAHNGMDEILLAMIRQILTITLLVSLFGIAVAYILVSLALKPVSRLASAMEVVGGGDFSQRFTTGFMDEVGKLTSAFNTMLIRLSQLTEERSQYQKELERKEYLRRQLQEKIISSQEEERKRISRELHDDTGQSLTTLKLVLKKIEKAADLSEVNNLTRDMRELLSKTIEGVRSLSLDLRPSVLDDLGLIAALKRYLQDSSERLNLSIDFHEQGLEAWQPDSFQSTTIYRVVQEALTNIAKHAKAKNVSVIIEKQRDNILVIVEDDGVGFDTEICNNREANRPCLGIFGMQERAILVRGELVVESAPGQGTTLYFKLPLEEGKNNGGENRDTAG